MLRLRSGDISDHNSTNNTEAHPVLWPNGDGTCEKLDRRAEPLLTRAGQEPPRAFECN